MVKQVLTTEPLPLDPQRRFPRYHEGAGPVARRQGVVTLYERQLRMSRMRLRGRGMPRCVTGDRTGGRDPSRPLRKTGGAQDDRGAFRMTTSS
jgi:hypothetical protein